MNYHDCMCMAWVFSDAPTIRDIPQLNEGIQWARSYISIFHYCNCSDHIRMSHLSLEIQYFWRSQFSILLCNGNLILQLSDIDTLRNEIKLLIKIRFSVMDEILKPFSLNKFTSFHISLSFLNTSCGFLNRLLIKILISN